MMASFFKSLLHLFWLAVSVALIWFFWTGAIPEKMEGTSSESGMEMQLRMTGTRGLTLTFRTTLVLKAPDGEVFQYAMGRLESRETVEKLTDSMRWENDSTLSFEHPLKKKRTVVSYTNGLWGLIEQTK